MKIIVGTLITTFGWVMATFFTPATDDKVLRNFYRLIKPGGSGWDAVIKKANAEGDTIEKEIGQLPLEILSMVMGCIAVYGALFATGFWLYGETASAMVATVITGGAGYFLFWVWSKLKTESE